MVGGDGTCSNVAEEILNARSECRLALIPCGTGNDFAKTLGVDQATPTEIFRLVANGNNARIDVGRADGHYFLNSCGFGFATSVLEASNRMRFLRGDAVYICCALAQLFSYRGIDVAANGVADVDRGKKLMVTVSNGRSFGGAFRIAPDASVVDGELDACFFGDVNALERARLFAAALRGTHLHRPGVSSLRTRQLTLSFTENPAMEIDGELRHAKSTTVELKCIPRALSVIAAPGALV